MTDPIDDGLLLDAVLGPTAERLREVNLPLHILLENRFGELNDNQLEMIHAAQDAARAADSILRLLDRVRRLRDSMRKPAPQVELPLTRPIDLLRAALLVASAEAGERGVRVQSDLSPALPYVRVDRALMEEAATILLRAAVRGAAEGKAVAVTATLQLAEVVIEIQSASAAVVGLDETLAALLIEASGARFAREAQQQLIRCPTGAPAVP